MPKLATQRFARRVELAPLAANAARPGVASQRVDHRAAHAPFGEGLELDAARRVEAVGSVDQAEHAVLDEVADIDRVRHRGRHASSEGLDKRKSGNDATILVRGNWLGAHADAVSQCWYQQLRQCPRARLNPQEISYKLLCFWSL